MSSSRIELQNAINRALKAANRALKVNAFNKVAEIYYRIASMLNDLGDEEGAKNFADAAKEFKEKNQILTQIKISMRLADQAYKNEDYATVAENYLKISSLSELFGDINTAQKFKVEADRFLESAKYKLRIENLEIATMSQVASGIQSHIPSTIELNQNVDQIKPEKGIEMKNALTALGLVCSQCGREIDPDLPKCPYCKAPI